MKNCGKKCLLMCIFLFSNTHLFSNFDLKIIMNGPTQVYPGQTLLIGYELHYSKNFEIIHRYLPLFNSSNLVYLGEPKIEYSYEKKGRLLRMNQKVIASKPGKIAFGPSFILGSTDSEEEVEAKALGFSFEVLEFPLEKQPRNFLGAIGEYTMQSSIEVNKVTLGNFLKMELVISGSGDLDSIKPPDLSFLKDKGIEARLFSIEGNKKGIAKHFSYNLTFLSAQINEVPSLSFSFFEPYSKTYKTVWTKPLFISVVDYVNKREKQSKRLPVFQKEKSSSSVIFLKPKNELRNRQLLSFKIILVVLLALSVLWYLLPVIRRNKFSFRNKVLDFLEKAKNSQNEQEAIYYLKQAIKIRYGDKDLPQKIASYIESLESYLYSLKTEKELILLIEEGEKLLLDS
jgi:hypothetical protein